MSLTIRAIASYIHMYIIAHIIPVPHVQFAGLSARYGRSLPK